jgi:hypothetical protein
MDSKPGSTVPARTAIGRDAHTPFWSLLMMPHEKNQDQRGGTGEPDLA